MIPNTLLSAPRRPLVAPLRHAKRSPPATRVHFSLSSNPTSFSTLPPSMSSPHPQQQQPTPFTPPSLDLHVMTTDYLVIGSGIAGLTFALDAAQHGRVTILTKAEVSESCTRYAQGGVCAVLDANDSVESHVRDTLIAGCHLNDEEAVRIVCAEGPARVLDLAARGASFTHNANGASFHLTREGGHSHRRIVHAADATGAEIERALVASIRAHPRITLLEHHHALDLVLGDVTGVSHCLGVDALHVGTKKSIRVLAYATLLASGGAGQVYRHTTNPHVVTGDGIAMAYRAGANVANMEFVQFHPTGMYEKETKVTGGGGAGHALSSSSRFLITEAVRGEGGLLLNQAGERFMPRIDPRAELAPRDVVARAIHAEMTTRGEEHVWLDISHKPSSFIKAHFPNIHAHCAARGLDMTREPIPVVPVQHYLCGGIVAGLHGETSLPGLYACGEVACSGLHGANRLASNSLLEGLVFAHRAVQPSTRHASLMASSRAQAAYMNAARAAVVTGPVSVLSAESASSRAWLSEARATVQEAMWRGAGIVRSTRGLRTALASLHEVASELHVQRAMVKGHVSLERSEVMNLCTVGALIVHSALQRLESRGGHYLLEYPTENEALRRATIVDPASPLSPLHYTTSGAATYAAGVLAAKKKSSGRSFSPSRRFASKDVLVAKARLNED